MHCPLYARCSLLDLRFLRCHGDRRLELGKYRHGKRVDADLQQRAGEKLVEVEERIADLVIIRDNLTAAMNAGCDDLIACVSADCCPIPFEAITIHPGNASPRRR